jgi:hypothetical protein
MVQICVMLALVIGQIFLSKVLVYNFVPNPEKMHLHRSRMLSLDGNICYLDRHGIVARDKGFRLQLAHIGKCESKYNSCLAIVVQCDQFRLGSGCNDKFQYGRANVESPV